MGEREKGRDLEGEIDETDGRERERERERERLMRLMGERELLVFFKIH